MLGSMTIRNLVILSARGLFYTLEFDVFGRQILTYEDSPSAERADTTMSLRSIVNNLSLLLLFQFLKCPPPPLPA